MRVSSYERKNADDRAIAPKGLQGLAQGFNRGIHRSRATRPEKGWKACAPLAFRTVERSPRAIPGAIAVHLERRCHGVNVA